MSRPFSLLIKPASADCNLRCDYCFYLDRAELYPQSHTHRMSREVLERVVGSYLATEQPQYGFAWQGGEPTLMGLDFFKQVTSLQQLHGRRGAVVSNGLQTNGILISDELAQHLAHFNFLLGVSLDGPAEIHDLYRRTVGGTGSHGKVLSGIDRLKNNGVEFNILTLVSQANVRRGADIYRYLCGQGFRFHQYIECVEFADDGSLAPFAINGEEWGEFLCAIFDEWIKGDVRSVSVRHFDNVLNKLVDGVNTVCKMGDCCDQYFVVEHNGDVYPCDFYVQSKLKLGNILDTTWEELLRSAVYRNFAVEKSAYCAECSACEFLNLCVGDCTKNRPAKDATRLSVLCSGWKKFYGHTLERFEGLARQVVNERHATIGRNEPCFCGSGKKFKRCHGRSRSPG
jgi:uncharacterized protein